MHGKQTDGVAIDRSTHPNDFALKSRQKEATLPVPHADNGCYPCQLVTAALLLR